MDPIAIAGSLLNVLKQVDDFVQAYRSLYGEVQELGILLNQVWEFALKRQQDLKCDAILSQQQQQQSVEVTKKDSSLIEQQLLDIMIEASVCLAALDRKLSKNNSATKFISFAIRSAMQRGGVKEQLATLKKIEGKIMKQLRLVDMENAEKAAKKLEFMAGGAAAMHIDNEEAKKFWKCMNANEMEISLSRFEEGLRSVLGKELDQLIIPDCREQIQELIRTSVDSHNSQKVSVQDFNNFVGSGSEGLRLAVLKRLESKCGRAVIMSRQHGDILDMKFGCGYLFTASEDSTIKIWSVPSFESYGTLIGHTGRVNTLDIAQLPSRSIDVDKLCVVSGGADSTILLWDVHALKKIAVLTGHSGAVTKIIAVKDRLFSCSVDKSIRLWSLTQQVCNAVLGCYMTAVTDMVMPSWGELLYATAADGSLQFFDVSNGETRFNMSVLDHLTDGVEKFIVADCVDALITAHTSGQIFMRDAFSGKIIKQLASNTRVSCLSTVGDCLFAGDRDEKVLHLWHIGRIGKILDSQECSVTSTCEECDIPQELHQKVKITVKARSLLFLPHSHVQHFGAASHETGGTLLVGDCSGLMIGIHLPSLVQVLQIGSQGIWTRHSSNVRAGALCDDGSLLATGSWDKTVKLFKPISSSISQDQFLADIDVGSEVYGVSFGNYVDTTTEITMMSRPLIMFVGLESGELVVYDCSSPSDPQLLIKEQAFDMYCWSVLCCDRRNEVYAAGLSFSDGSPNGVSIRVFKVVLSNATTSASCVPDATGINNSNMVQLIHDGSFIDHEGEVFCLTQHEDVLFSASNDGTVRSWDLITRTARAVYRTSGTAKGFRHVAIGENLVAAGGMGNCLFVWRLASNTIVDDQPLLLAQTPVPANINCVKIISNSCVDVKFVWVVVSQAVQGSDILIFDAKTLFSAHGHCASPAIRLCGHKSSSGLLISSLAHPLVVWTTSFDRTCKVWNLAEVFTGYGAGTTISSPLAGSDLSVHLSICRKVEHCLQDAMGQLCIPKQPQYINTCNTVKRAVECISWLRVARKRRLVNAPEAQLLTLLAASFHPAVLANFCCFGRDNHEEQRVVKKFCGIVARGNDGKKIDMNSVMGNGQTTVKQTLISLHQSSVQLAIALNLTATVVLTNVYFLLHLCLSCETNDDSSAILTGLAASVDHLQWESLIPLVIVGISCVTNPASMTDMLIFMSSIGYFELKEFAI